MPVLITGAGGFIGKNLSLRLSEKGIEVIRFLRGMTSSQLDDSIEKCDFIFHLAGANRPDTDAEFDEVNWGLTQEICNSCIRMKKHIPIVFSSSIQATGDTLYGKSKRKAEEALKDFHHQTQSPIFIYRLPNVFGKWAKPNYNSVVATFCHNIAIGKPIQIHNSEALVELVYIDDVLDSFLTCLVSRGPSFNYPEVGPVYKTTVGDIAEMVGRFKHSSQGLLVENVGEGFVRALFSTYLSFLSPAQFSYSLISYPDSRGTFSEFLKTQSAGQISFFSAHPGVIRGGHYHHTKNERFLVVQGKAKFRFRNVMNGETYELLASDSQPKVVQTVPGWAHDITNIGQQELIVLLWSNEVFDKERPDTIAFGVEDEKQIKSDVGSRNSTRAY